MAQKDNYFVLFSMDTADDEPQSSENALCALSSEERAALLREIREKVDALGEAELRHLYSLLLIFELKKGTLS
jgi:hypothetical protein